MTFEVRDVNQYSRMIPAEEGLWVVPQAHAKVSRRYFGKTGVIVKLLQKRVQVFFPNDYPGLAPISVKPSDLLAFPEQERMDISKLVIPESDDIPAEEVAAVVINATDGRGFDYHKNRRAQALSYEAAVTAVLRYYKTSRPKAKDLVIAAIEAGALHGVWVNSNGWIYRAAGKYTTNGWTVVSLPGELEDICLYINESGFVSGNSPRYTARNNSFWLFDPAELHSLAEKEKDQQKKRDEKLKALREEKIAGAMEVQRGDLAILYGLLQAAGADPEEMHYGGRNDGLYAMWTLFSEDLKKIAAVLREHGIEPGSIPPQK